MKIHFPSTFLFLLFPQLLSISSSSPPPPPPEVALSPAVACKSTPYPKLCRTVLSNTFNSPKQSNVSNSYHYSKFSIKQSLKQAQRLSKAINYHLTHKKQLSKLNKELIGALGDCQELSNLNVDYLYTISSELKSAESLSDELVERVMSLLSGVITNQETCFDELVLANKGSNALGFLYSPLVNGSQLYSVSLGLVTHALEQNLKKNKRKNVSPLQRGVKNHVREPLQALIKVLRTQTCYRSAKCIRAERILDQLDNNGILINNTVTVGPNGSDENYTSIADAIAIVPNNSRPEDGYFVIYVKEGYYHEYVVIPKYKKNILLIGDGINQTVITGNHSFVDGWTTFNSCTFAVAGERFVAVDVTFRNTAGPEKHQAVAVRNNADLSAFYRCSFEGYQDTLYAHSMRQFYRECDVYGTVDFIFGNAAAVFQGCNLYARKPLPNQKNAFTAQGRTDPNQNTGISIQNSSIKAAPDLATDLNSTLSFLGRPWKPYSRTIFMLSYIGEVIASVGWLEWNGTVGLDTLYYGEFENYGPRANTSTRVRWPGYNVMNATQALNFTLYNFNMGDTWLPDADIPFFPGLI